MEFALAILIVALVAVFVSVPLRAKAGADGTAGTVATADPELAGLEARKQAKYREIRDTELDRAQGKLTESDFKRQRGELRAEAISILKQIDARKQALGPSDAERKADAEAERPS